MPTQQQKSEAPQFGQFDNPITAGILLLMISLSLCGLYLLYSGNFLVGVIFLLSAFMIINYGKEDHKPSKPREAGLITILDSPLLFFGKYILVSGTVWVIPWLMSTIKFAMDNVDETFKGKDFVFQTKDDVPMIIEVSFTGAPDPDDLLDFIQAGADMKKICSQIREIIFRETQKIVREMESLEVQTQGEKLSELLTTCVLEAHSFGIKISKLQVIPALPEEIRKKMVEVAREKYDREAEELEIATNLLLAEKKQHKKAKEYEPTFDSMSSEEKDEVISRLVVTDKLIPSIDHYVALVIEEKLVAQGRATSIHTSSGAKTVAIVPPSQQQ